MVFHCECFSFTCTREVNADDATWIHVAQTQAELARQTPFYPVLIYCGIGVGGWGGVAGRWGTRGAVAGVSRARRRGRQWWKNRIRGRWREGMWRRREGAGHLSSGESAVWPGRESGPLAGTTHEHEHVCRTHAHTYACIHGGNCGQL